MKKFAVFPAIFFSLLLLLSPIVMAAEDTLDSGYSVRKIPEDNPYSGEEPVTIIAETTNSKVCFILFKWFAPDGRLVHFRIFFAKPNGATWTNSSGTYTIYSAEDTYTPNIPGHWRVKVVFLGIGGYSIFYWYLCRFAIRTSSFNVIPEIPVLGSIGVASAMFSGFFVYKKKKK